MLVSCAFLWVCLNGFCIAFAIPAASPGTTFVVKETSAPVNYHYGKTVTYVTKCGKALTDEGVKTRIKVGIPVSVHYLPKAKTV